MNDNIRSQFPILKRQIHGQPLVYFDNAATTQKPEAVLAAMDKYYRNSNANVNRGAHTLGAEATEAVEHGRETVRQFINASSTEEIIFTKGTTESLNLLANSLEHIFEPGDVILLTEMEHHANLLPWQELARRKNVTLKFIPVTEEGRLDLRYLDGLDFAKIKLVSLVQVSNTLGRVNPVKEIVARVREQVGLLPGGMPPGIKKENLRFPLIAVDGAQAVAHVPVDVRDLGCDFYAFSAHKMYGPMGVGALYAREEVQPLMTPWQVGGGMVEEVSLESITYQAGPAKFEPGTPNVSGVVGLTAAIEWMRNSIDWDEYRRYEHEMVESLVSQFSRLSHVHSSRRVSSLPAQGGLPLAAGYEAAEGKVNQISPVKLLPGLVDVGIVSFNIEGVHPHDVATYLDAKGIAVRAGHHCTQPLMKKLGVDGTVRVSFGVYNTLAEVERLGEAMEGFPRELVMV